MSEYERIKSSYLTKEEVWEDPHFPANQLSVFYHQTPPFDFVWKRAKDIYTNPKFIADDDETFDVIPGKLGDKWLASCIGILYLHKGLLYRVVPADQNMDTSYAGVFRFRIWWCGQWLEVLVDDLLPTVNGRLVFMQTTRSEQLWPALLEKAYAKLHGSYEALKYGSFLDGISELTGGICESIALHEQDDANLLHSLVKSTSIVTAQYSPHHNEAKTKGLELEMHYKVCNVDKVESIEGPFYVVQLLRPFTIGETPPSHIICDPARWNAILSYERERLTSTARGIWMLYSDFQKLFSKLEIVHLDDETSKAELTFEKNRKWQMKMHQGGWMRGVSAGGCRNFVHSFHVNPQIQLILNEPDTVIISLNQHSMINPRVIGFSIYKMPKYLTETAAPIFFKRIKSTINSQYTNSRQVSHRCHLESCAYLIVPTTFEPRVEADFTLRIFSNKSLKMKVLDYTPEMLRNAVIKAPPGIEASSFAQYEVMFFQLADEHRTIDIFELQDLLNACLPNDYIKSCASIETCRQIVLSMDKTGTGRINLSDFKDLMCSLKHWQLVFKSHAREKMGVVRVERLRDALREVGFVVPEKVMALLVLRYMRKDGMLRFGDFVSAVMHLHRAFNVFYMRDTTHRNNVSLNLTEWLKNVLMC